MISIYRNCKKLFISLISRYLHFLKRIRSEIFQKLLKVFKWFQNITIGLKRVQ